MNFTTSFIPICDAVNRGSQRVIVLLLLGLAPMAHALNLELLGTTATQAVFRYETSTPNSCTLFVSEFSTFSNVNDVNSNLFPGSNLDTRAIVDGSVRTVIIGSRTTARSGDRSYSRALRSGTKHSITVTCSDGSSSMSFTTASISGIVPEAPPFLLGADGNLGVPDFDWNDRSKPIIDPQSGAALYRVGDPRDYSSDSGHNFSPGLDQNDVGFPEPVMTLDGKTAPHSIEGAVTKSALAALSSPEVLFLPIDSTKAQTWGGWNNTGTQGHPVTDLAIQISGQGTGSTDIDRTIDVCLSIDSGATCHTGSISVAMPIGASSDLGLFPRSYPSPLFAGWGKVITREFFTTIGYVSVAGSSVTLTKDELRSVINGNSQSAKSRFHEEWPAGARIFVANSAPECQLNYCTIASVESQTKLTIRESLNLGDTPYQFAGLGFRLAKRTSVGNVSLSASYRIAKSYIVHQGSGSGCSVGTVSVNVDRSGNPIGRTITGRLCIFPLMYESGGRLYFVGESEPDIRLLSLIKHPFSIPGHSSADLPTALLELAGPNIPTFNELNPNVFYNSSPTQSGSTAIFKLTYVGDYRENSAAFWKSSVDTTPAVGQTNIVWENMTKSVVGNSINQQILQASTYSELKWGPLKLRLAGLTSRYTVFHTPPVGGRESACWIFVFEAATGNYVRGWNTLDGGGDGSLAGSCHAVQIMAGKILVANNGLTDSNPNNLWGGPFEVPLASLKRGANFSPNTALPASPDGSYDGTCPSDLPQRWKDQGAVGNECFTVRINREPCSSVATAHERLHTPCPGDSTKSWVGSPIGVGQDFYDSRGFCDNEHLMIVRRNDLPGGTIELVLLRDAAPGYCCSASNSRGRRCLGSPAQSVHESGWALRMKPRGSCCSCTQLYDPATGNYLVEEQTITRGHFAYQALGSGNHTFVGIGTNNLYVSRFDAPPTSFGGLETSSFSFFPKYAGAAGGLQGTEQSYISIVGDAAGDTERKFATDWRHPNGSLGLAPEQFGQTIGVPYSLSQQPSTSSVYKVNGISGFYHLKLNPLIVWAGRYVLGEKSSPELGNTLTDADTWRFCFVYRAGECRFNSVVGDVYVVAPGLETSVNRCHASQVSYRSLCIFGASPTFGQLMQVRIDKDDLSGQWQRRLGYGLTRPGSQYVYSHARPYPSGKALFFTAWNLQGVYSVPVMMQLPDWPSDGTNRTTFIPVSVRGAGNSYVEFGYEENGRRNDMFCTPRAEACRVSAATYAENDPFQYASEALTRASGNWTITIPVLPGRVLFYRVVKDDVRGPLQTVAVP